MEEKFGTLPDQRDKFIICSTCRERKIFSLFYFNKSRKSGFESDCKECSKKRSREKAIFNTRPSTEKSLLRSKLWKQDPKNKEKIKENNRKYYLKNKWL